MAPVLQRRYTKLAELGGDAKAQLDLMRLGRSYRRHSQGFLFNSRHSHGFKLISGRDLVEMSAPGGDARPLSHLFLSKSLYSFIISYFGSMARARGSDKCCPSPMLGTVLKTLHLHQIDKHTTSFCLKAALFT